MTIQEKELFKVRLENCKLYMKNKGVTSTYLFFCNFYNMKEDKRKELEPIFRKFWRGDKEYYDESLLSQYEDMIETLTHE